MISMISGVGWRPARSTAGSADGRMLNTTNVTPLTTTRSPSMPSRRRAMKPAITET